MEHKNAALQATTGREGSWASLLNPFSPLTDGVDKIPRFMSGITGSDKGDWLLAKVGAIGLIAAATAGGIRLAKHLKHMATGKDSDNPAYKIGEQIGTTFNPELSKSASAKVYKPDALSLENISNVALPLLALGLGGYAGWKLSDREFDRARNNDLTVDIEDKQDLVNRLIRSRARLAKGTATDDEIEAVLQEAGDKSPYVHRPMGKSAGASSAKDTTSETVGRWGVALPGLALLALAGFSGIASYRYFKKTDEDNIKYNAVKKGLREYVKWKNINAPINITPVNPEEYFGGIDPEDTPKSARTEPEAVETRSGLSVTL